MMKHSRSDTFEIKRDRMRRRLRALNWHLAGDALEYAEAHHSGVRKDGVTPEFDHQMSIAYFLWPSLSGVRLPQETIATVFLHDVPEDYDVTFAEITDRFGATVGRAVRAMTKCHDGVTFDPAEVAARQASDAIASVVKGGDRVHNQSTMTGVFTPTKVQEYLQETRSLILPMLFRAAHEFPDQRMPYRRLLAVLNSQDAIYG